MPGKKGLCEINKVINRLVVGVCPERCKFKAVGSLLHPLFTAGFLFDSTYTGCVGIILGSRSVADNKKLNVFIKSAACPEGITLIAVNLIERFFQCNATPFQLHMNQRKAIDKYRNVIAVFEIAALLGVLVNHLKRIVMDILFINQRDIFASSVVTPQNLNIVLLNKPCFFNNAGIIIGKLIFEKGLPFLVREMIIVQFFKL